MGEACYGCVKYLMFAFNFLFMVLGAVLVGLGLWVRFDSSFKTYTENFKSLLFLENSHYFLILIGVVIMVIGFFGCCGALRESQCMMIVFFLLLLIIFCTLIGLGIWGFVAKDSLKQSVDEIITKAVHDYKNNKKFVDTIQSKLECCGASGSKDYILDLKIPDSCPTSLLSAVTNINNGCSKKVFLFFNQQIVIIACVSICIGVITMIGMAFSCILLMMINQEDPRYIV